jgi:hypothetical protein
MFRNIRWVCLGAVLALGTATTASAQTIDSGEVMFHFGALHLAPGQAIAINYELTDHFGEPLTLPVELRIEDKNGASLFDRTLTVSDGHAISFIIGTDIRALRAAVSGDIYAAIAPEIRTLQPCIKVNWPPGPTTPVDRMTLTLEVIDLTTGRIVSVANNPHAIIGVLRQ